MTVQELLKDGFEEVSGRRGYRFFRKAVNGRGVWYAEKDGEVKRITYAQAIRNEPIDSGEAMAMTLGRILLPHY